MHAHDRTLIGKLGFGDPDRRNDEHDLACQFLASKVIAHDLVKSTVFGPFIGRAAKATRSMICMPSEIDCPCGSKIRYATADIVDADEVIKPKTEVPICKGDGQYRTTIGFLDVLVWYELTTKIEGSQHKPVWEAYEQYGQRYSRIACKYVDYKDIYFERGNLAIEVKIQRTSVGECIRQINLYKSYFSDGDVQFFLATRYPIFESEAALLKNERIEHIHLGPRFEEWAEGQRKATRTSEKSILF